MVVHVEDWAVSPGETVNWWKISLAIFLYKFLVETMMLIMEKEYFLQPELYKFA